MEVGPLHLEKVVPETIDSTALQIEEGDLTAQKFSSSGMYEFGGATESERRQNDRQAKARASLRIQRRAGSEKRCRSCGTTTTPVWRWGGSAKDTLLCNACSLRIRRSAARPNRPKSPSERPAKRQSSASGRSDSGGSPSPSSTEQLSLQDLEALHQRLVGFMQLERARLLGTYPGSEPDPYWMGSTWGLSSEPRVFGACPTHPMDWFPNTSPIRNYSGSDESHLDFPLQLDTQLPSLDGELVPIA